MSGSGSGQEQHESNENAVIAFPLIAISSTVAKRVVFDGDVPTGVLLLVSAVVACARMCDC